MQIFLSIARSLRVLLVAVSLVSQCLADFNFNFSSGVENFEAKTFFFLLSNTSSPPTFASPFGSSGGFLNLTTDKFQTAHAIWYRKMQFVDDGFNFTFQFRIPDGSPQSGDGLAFVVQASSMGPFDPYLVNPPDYCPVGALPAGCQPNPPKEFERQSNEPLAIGAPGAGIGYSGIAESLVVEFDMWKDLDNNVSVCISRSVEAGLRRAALTQLQDPNDNHISIHNNGAGQNNAEERQPTSGGSQLAIQPNVVPRMSNGQVHTVRIEYKPLQQRSGQYPGMCPILVFYDNDVNPSVIAPCGPRESCKCLSSLLPNINKISRQQMRGYSWIGLTASTGNSIQTHQISRMAFSGSPKVLEIRPWAGPVEGGTSMTIIGDNFRLLPGARCIFGTIQTALTLLNGETAVCISPPSVLKQRHLVNLTIMFSSDDIANLEPSSPCPGFSQPTISFPCTPYQMRVDRFYYYINPTVTQVTPHSGPEDGGTAITLTGTGFYPELMSISSCYHGISSFSSVSLIGRLALDPNVTDFTTTMTQVVCPKTSAAPIGQRIIFFSMNSQQPATNQPIPGYMDRRTLRFPMYSTGFFFYAIPRLDGIMPSGMSADDPSDRTITVYGNFTVTDDMTCTFDASTVPASYFVPYEKFIKMYSNTDRLQCNAPLHTWAYSVPFTLSLNGQQQIPVQLQFRFDNTFGFLLMAGSVGLFGLLILTCCSYSCYSFYNMADYRTLLSPEYLELTGKTRWRVIKDIISARGASERQELVRVLEKLKQVQNKPQSRWKSAVGATLNARSQNADSGWDKLLAGDFEGSAATAVAQPAQSLEKKGKTGWTSIVNKTEVGSGPRARSATATAAASKWAASASLKQS